MIKIALYLPYHYQDISMGEMIIEYSGTLIRPGLCDIREKYYDSKVSGDVT